MAFPHLYPIEIVENFTIIHFMLDNVPLRTLRFTVVAEAQEDGTLSDDAYAGMVNNMQITAKANNVPHELEKIEGKLEKTEDGMWMLTCYMPIK